MKKNTLIILSMLSSITTAHAVGFSTGNPGTPFTIGSTHIFNAMHDLPKLITVLVYAKKTMDR